MDKQRHTSSIGMGRMLWQRLLVYILRRQTGVLCDPSQLTQLYYCVRSIRSLLTVRLQALGVVRLDFRSAIGSI